MYVCDPNHNIKIINSTIYLKTCETLTKWQESLLFTKTPVLTTKTDLVVTQTVYYCAQQMSSYKCLQVWQVKQNAFALSLSNLMISV